MGYVLQMAFLRIMNPVYILMPTQSEQPACGGSTLLRFIWAVHQCEAVYLEQGRRRRERGGRSDVVRAVADVEEGDGVDTAACRR